MYTEICQDTFSPFRLFIYLFIYKNAIAWT